MVISAPSSRHSSSLRRGSGGDRHPGTQRAGDLDGVGADAAGAAVHEQQLALAEVRRQHQVRPHRARHLGQPGRVAAGRRRPESAGSARRERRRIRRIRRPPAKRRLLARATSRVTSSPTAATTPETSMPSISLAPGGGGYWPAACSRSARLTPAAPTLISTSPRPGRDVGDLLPRELIGGFHDDGVHARHATTCGFRLSQSRCVA